MNYISENQLYEDYILERDLFDFVDNLENFQSRHKKKKEYIVKKPHLIDLYHLDHAELVIKVYRQKMDKENIKDPKEYFKKLYYYDKETLLKEIGFKESKIQKYKANLEYQANLMF